MPSGACPVARGMRHRIRRYPAQGRQICRRAARETTVASTSRASVDEGTPGTVAAEIRKLSDLLDMSQTLGSTLNLKSGLSRVLEILAERHGALSASVMLLDRESGQLVIEASTGVQWQAASRARYRMGEGITGRVVQSGKPIVVPRVSQEPLFLNRTGVVKQSGRSELSFICVPIAIDKETVGALGVALPYDKAGHYDREAKFFGIVASMLAQAVRVHNLVEAERQRLLQENMQLRQELKERYDYRNIVGNSRPMQAV